MNEWMAEPIATAMGGRVDNCPDEAVAAPFASGADRRVATDNAAGR